MAIGATQRNPRTYRHMIAKGMDKFDSACGVVYGYLRPFAHAFSLGEHIIKIHGGPDAIGTIGQGILVTMSVTTSARAIPAFYDLITLRVFYEIDPDGDYKRDENGSLVFKQITVMVRDVTCKVAFLLTPVSRWESAGAYTLPNQASLAVNSTISGLFALVAAADVVVQIQKLSEIWDAYQDDPSDRNYRALIKQGWHLERAIVELLVSAGENGYTHLNSNPIFGAVMASGLIFAGINNILVDTIIDKYYDE